MRSARRGRLAAAALAATAVVLGLVWRALGSKPDLAVPTPPAQETVRVVSGDAVSPTRPDAAALPGDRQDRASPTLHGVLIDTGTGRPVRGFFVGAGERRVGPSAWSAADGTFTLILTGADAQATEPALWVIDEDGQDIDVVEATRPSPDVPLTVRVQAGVAFVVDLLGPPRAPRDGWFAKLVLQRENKTSTELAPPAALRPVDEPERLRYRVRFPRSLEGADLPWLAVETLQGWSGIARVESLEPTATRPLQIEVRERTWLAGRVAYADGGPPPKVTAQLAPAAAGQGFPSLDLDWSYKTAYEGSLRFDDLEPGSYFLVLGIQDRPPGTRIVDVQPGENDLGVVILPGAAPTSFVEGVLESASGRPGLSVFLQLEALDGSGWARTWWDGEVSPLISAYYGVGPKESAGDETLKTFRFEGVPPGAYQLRVAGWDGFRYDPEELTVTAPAEGLRIVRRDEGVDFGFGFVVRDAHTGETLPRYRARIHTAVWGKEASHEHESGAVLGRTVADGTLLWAVFADGYAPQWGDMSAFPSAGDPRFATVDLEPGWGIDLTVRDGRDPRRTMHRSQAALTLVPRTSNPLAGVAVMADGVAVGHTDAAGRLRIRLDAQPGQLELSLPGWVAVPSTSFAHGEVQMKCPSPEAYLVPH